MSSLAIKELDSNNKEKETIALELQLLEESRMLLMQRLEEEPNLRGKEINLSTLSASVDEALGAPLVALQSGLKSLLGDIREMNETNKNFLHHSLEHIQWTVGMMKILEAGSMTYEPSGGVRDEGTTGRVISREL